MLLIIEDWDDNEDSFEVADNTSLRSCLYEGFWLFKLVGGGQIARNVGMVARVDLGNVVFSGDEIRDPRD